MNPASQRLGLCKKPVESNRLAFCFQIDQRHGFFAFQLNLCWVCSAVNQVSLLTLMVGNLLEKSLALAAILTATWRATAL